jgi:hypothetical protein
MILFYSIFPLPAIFGLAASPPHGDIRPCGLAPSRKSIFYSPHGDIDFLFASRRNRFSIQPHGKCRFIFLSPPPGDIDFLFASRRMSILYFSRPLTAKSIFYSPHGEIDFLFSLTANVDFILLSPIHGEIDFLFSLTANVDFILLSPIHGEIDFLFTSRRMSILLRFMALINFLFGSRQEPISFHLHGTSCLKAVIIVLIASRRDSVSFRFAPDGNIDILSPHVDN